MLLSSDPVGICNPMAANDMRRNAGNSMKHQAFNPDLPLDTYLPDTEAHVFGDRVYVYGSHDRENGAVHCMLDYICWSAPVTELSDRRYEGVIYERNQDPHYTPDTYLWAPDGEYRYQGVIISNADLGYRGNALPKSPARSPAKKRLPSASTRHRRSRSAGWYKTPGRCSGWRRSRRFSG